MKLLKTTRSNVYSKEFGWLIKTRYTVLGFFNWSEYKFNPLTRTYQEEI